LGTEVTSSTGYQRVQKYFQPMTSILDPRKGACLLVETHVSENGFVPLRIFIFNGFSARLPETCGTERRLTVYYEWITFEPMAKQIRTVRIKPADLKELERLAKREDETVSFLIQRAIREFLERMAKKASKA
jgi:S-adenosylmethionine:diacylglycerol 3-amino-3-carboxypropyl transferase